MECPCCHQRIRKLNPHRMCSQKVALLEQLAKVGTWVKISTGQHRQVAGDAAVLVLRLVWFGLVEHDENNRSGMYRVTQNGLAFLQNNHTVPRVVWCRDGKVVDQDSEMIGINSVKNVVLDKAYWDSYWMLQQPEWMR